MVTSHYYQTITILCVLLGSEIIIAEEQPKKHQVTEIARIYRSPEERRDAGLGTPLTDWLKFSGLVEVESQYQNEFIKDHPQRSRVTTPNVALQLGFEFTFTDWLGAELIVEADYDGNVFVVDLDEALINIETEQWGIKAGRQFVAFGAYFSHFISGPMLEFGETRGNALSIDYSPVAAIEFTTFIFDSNYGNSDFDWGISIDYVSEYEAVRIGASFLSDLAASEQRLLQGIDSRQSIPAWSAYALLGFDDFEVTVETVQAISAFTELDQQSDQPQAYNLEIAYFYTPSTQFAMRIEYSDELSDHPKWQSGVAATWRPIENLSISLEYLYARFQENFAFDDKDRELSERHLATMQLALEF